MTSSRLTARFLPSLLFAALLGGSLVSPGPALAQELPDWENPQVVGINKLDPHAPVYPFADEATARALDRSKSPYYRLLNGRWKFQFSPNPEARPKAFFETGFDDTAWDTIPVPSNIEKHGYAPPALRQYRLRLGLEHAARVPMSLDHVGAFRADLGDVPGSSDPPRIPHELNYVGSYRHRFEVPSAWQGRRVRITFQGVSAGFYLWVNGKKIGYSEDSRGPAEFDITDAVEAGREPAGGRGVPLHRRRLPRVPGLLAPVRDLPRRRPLVDRAAARRGLPGRSPTSTRSTATPPSSSTVTVANASATEQAFSARGLASRRVGQAVFLGALAQAGRAPAGQTATVSLEAQVPNPLKWSDEKPNLYTLLLTLEGRRRARASASCPGGSASARSRRETGRSSSTASPSSSAASTGTSGTRETAQNVRRDTMLKDIEILKQHNFNLVRTSHYPNVPEWYELADEYGIYLIAESNIESHGMGYDARQDARRTSRSGRVRTSTARGGTSRRSRTTRRSSSGLSATRRATG